MTAHTASTLNDCCSFSRICFDFATSSSPVRMFSVWLLTVALSCALFACHTCTNSHVNISTVSGRCASSTPLHQHHAALDLRSCLSDLPRLQEHYCEASRPRLAA